MAPDQAVLDRAPAQEVDRWPLRVAAAATALAVVLVLFELGEKSLWYDEAFSIGTIDRPFGDALWRLANWEVNQSPFFLLLAGWWRLGEGETFLRLLPAASTVLAVPALFVLGRRLVDARTGAIAALLLAVHPLAIQWGQQLRGYALVLLLVIVATHLLLRALERPEAAGPALAWAAVAATATYTHFFAFLVVATCVLWVLLMRPIPRRLLVTAGAAYAVLVLPLGWFLVTREGDPLSWVPGGSPAAVRSTARDLLGGTRPSMVAYVVAASAGTWAAVTVVRAGRTHGSTGSPWRSALPLLWATGPVVAVLVSTATVKPLLETRFLIVVVPGLALLAAVGVRSLGPRAGPILLAALLLTSCIGLRDWYRQPPHDDWRSVTALVASATDAGDALWTSPRGGVFAVQYYLDRMGAEPLVVVRPAPEDPPAGDRLAEVQSEVATRVLQPLDPAYVAWRDRHYELVEERRVDEIVVRTFERR